MKLKIDASGLNRLKDRLDHIGQSTIDELEEQVADLAMTLYARAQAIAEQKLRSGIEEYLDALSINETSSGNITSYTIKLDASANKWEEGWDSFDMKPGLLAGPNAQVGKNGNRFNTVPFEHAYSKNAPTSTTKGLNQSATKAIKMYGLDQIIKSSGNKALQGKVGVMSGKGIPKNLQGMAKYQYGKGKNVKSTFMTFRRVSDKSDAQSWIHPGYSGAKIFEELEELADQGMDDLIKQFLK